MRGIQKRRRFSLMGAHLELGPAMGGAKATIEGAYKNALHIGQQVAIASVDHEGLVAAASKMGIPAEVRTGPSGPFVVVG